MQGSEKTCVSCSRAIDEHARICPFCGADPETGRKLDVKPLIESHFPPPPELTATERIAEFFRTHQMATVAVLVLVGVLALIGAHQWIQQRNENAVAPTPGVTLTEIADLARQTEERVELPLPELPFEGDGDPSRIRTFVLEPGAIAPPPEPAPGQTQPAANPNQAAPGPAAPARPAPAPPGQQPPRPSAPPAKTPR